MHNKESKREKRALVPESKTHKRREELGDISSYFKVLGHNYETQERSCSERRLHGEQLLQSWGYQMATKQGRHKI
ncbi:hypothetical protein OAE76_00870 [bacterium]|nr:hypothetical protein [bacterium]